MKKDDRDSAMEVPYHPFFGVQTGKGGSETWRSGHPTYVLLAEDGNPKTKDTGKKHSM